MLAAITALVIIMADQALKLAATGALMDAPGRKIMVIDRFFYLTLVHNRGAAFGIFPRQNLLFIILSILTISLLLIFYRRLFSRGHLPQISAGLILGGAVGNLIDRFRFDHVVDFLDFQFGSYHWPAFNLADSAICIGVALLIGVVLFGKEKSIKETQ
ncbi:MAG: signal peptidase II [Candidatus Euphemobacter frigidus]|nr:signal peptidase II [Candidatus Euphemobacter frigidus]MDP8276634.1 signal peptidase II [Candidatus Euphemobacter frigidus]